MKKSGKSGLRNLKQVTVLIDFNNQVWRSYHGADEMPNSNNVNVGCIVGLVKVLNNALNEAKKIMAYPRLVLCMDRKPMRKRELYKKYQNALKDYSPDKDWDGEDDALKIRYKGNRVRKDLNFNPVELCENYMKCIPHSSIFFDGEEADDVLASYVAKNDNENIMLYSTDKDLWQLLGKFPNLKIFKDAGSSIGMDDVAKFFETDNPEKVILHKMLRGDSGDNVKGVKKFQFKKTKAAYDECDGSFESYLYHLLNNFGIGSKYVNHILDNIPLLELNYQLVKLKTDIKYEIETVDKPNADNWRKLCGMHETPSLLRSSLIQIF